MLLASALGKWEATEMIKIGPAGSSGLGNLKGVSKVAEIGLDCMEVEFTYGVRMDLKTAKDVGALGEREGDHPFRSRTLLY